MKRALTTSIFLSIGIFLFTACETNQFMMDGYGAHGWGMGWGMWIVPLLVILVILYFLRTRRRN